MPRVIALDQLEQFTAINLLVDPGAVGGPKIIPSCADIVLGWLLPGGRVGHNVITGRYTGSFAGSVAQANSIFTALTTGGPATTFFGHLATEVSLVGLSIRDLAVANAPLINSTSPGIAGTGGGIALPNEVALVITKHTALSGRANRGRIYIPGLSTASVIAGNVASPTTVTDLQAWANTMQGAFNTGTYTMVIGHPARAAYTGSTGTTHPARAAGSEVVTSLFVRDNHFDSMRRRGLK